MTSLGTSRPDDLPRYFPKAEVRRFFEEIPEVNVRDRVLFDLMYRHGLRRGEAARLKLDDINLREQTIRVERLKGSRSGVYRLYPSSLRLLKKYLKGRVTSDNPYLFIGRRRGTHISTATIYYTCRKYAHAAQLSRSNPHAFRHSCGVHAANARLDLIDIADLLGHRSLSSALRYTAVSTQRRDQNYERIRISREFASTV